MDQKTFENLVSETVETINKLLVVKGGEYAGSDDRLANFKRGADLVGVTPLQCLFIYMSKHYDAFATFVRDKAAGRDRPRSEAIEGRLDDLINYCLLAKALVTEMREEPPELDLPGYHPLYVKFEDGGQEKVRDHTLWEWLMRPPVGQVNIWCGRVITHYSLDRGVTWTKVSQ